MEKKNNTQSFSICRKIRQTLASNPTFQAIHRIKQYYREPSPVVVTTHSNSPKNSHLPPQHHAKVKTQQGEGTIPIKFDYSTPESKKNGNSKVSMIQGQASKVASPQVGTSETRGKVAAKVEPLPQQHVPRQGKHGVGIQQHSEQQGKKSLDFNDTMAEYIQRAKYRIRTVSNVGQGQSNYSASHEANVYGNGSGTTTTTTTNKMEIHRDQFQDFIEKTKKKIRTTSNVGKTSSLKRG